MKKLKLVLPVGILLFSVLIAAVIVNSKDQIIPEKPEEKIQQLRVKTIKKESYRMVIPSQGTVRAKTESDVVAQVAGVITWVSPRFVAGGFFSEGEVLIKLDRRDYENRLTQAKYQVAQAERLLKMEEQQANIAQEEWARLNTGQAPPLVARSPQLAEAQALLASAKASLAQTKLDLERTHIVAPFSGRIRIKKADVGRYVSPGMSLATIYSTDAAEVRLPLPDRELAYLDISLNRFADQEEIGPEVVLSTRFAGQTHEWKGAITHLEGEVDPKSRMVHVSARVDQPYSVKYDIPLTVGMFVDAQILSKKIENLVVIPRSALRADDQVLIVDDLNRLRERKIHVYRKEKDRIFIDRGLETGDRLCLSNPATFIEGMKVLPIDEA